MTRERQDQSMFRGKRPPAADGGGDPGPPGDSGRSLPGSACLAPSRFWNAALAGGESAFTPTEREHLSSCPRCQDHFARVFQAVQVATTEAGAAPSTPEEDGWDLELVPPPHQQPIRRLAAEMPELRFAFEDGLIGVLTWRADGRHWLELEHPHALPITLLHLALSRASGELLWERFVLLYPGEGTSKAHLSLEEALLAGESDLVLTVQPLPQEPPLIEELPLWRTSLVQVRADDPEALPAWRTWAESLLAEATEPAVLLFLEQAMTVS